MVVCLTVSCTHNKTSLSIGPGVVSLSSPQDVIVEMTGETYDKLETILQQVSYVKLSAIPLLSRIKKIQKKYLQLIIPQYFISNKSGIWSLSLIVHSKG